MKKKLVLIPGLNNTAETWDGVVKRLSSSIEAYSVNVPALPDLNDIVDELLKELPERFYLCGFSFGGYVALKMLEKAPERVLGLVMMGSSTTADTENQIASRKKSIERAKNGEYFEMVEANAPRTFHPESLKNKEVVNLRTKIVKDYGVMNYIAHQQACMSRVDQTELLKGSLIPKLFIAGEEDKVVPASVIKELSEQAPCSEFILIANTGHMMPMEQPAAAADALSNWLEKLDNK